jgi:beta-glucosidase
MTLSSQALSSQAPPGVTPLESFGAVPAGWMWGTATAAHQIEGGNVGNDWWDWEHNPESGCAESSGDACDSWHRWPQDLRLVKDMGLDAYRFSLEWSRIMPAESEVSLAAIDHYRQMLIAAHELGLKTSVTLHHFTTPAWMAAKGGWANPEIVDHFVEYATVVSEHLGEHIDVLATFNEPNVVAAVGYLIGTFPPGHRGDREGFNASIATIVESHARSRDVMRAGPGNFLFGMTIAIPHVIIHADGDINSEGEPLTAVPAKANPDAPGWDQVGAYVAATKGDDYVGLQTYFTLHVDAQGEQLTIPSDWRVTQMGWTFTPEALGGAARALAATVDVPLIITENGVATLDDAERIEYYSRSLASLREAMDDGVDVRGFFAWSLLDNFEWAEGYRTKFGLAAVDPVTFERTPKPSAQWYAALVASTR